MRTTSIDAALRQTYSGDRVSRFLDELRQRKLAEERMRATLELQELYQRIAIAGSGAGGPG